MQIICRQTLIQQDVVCIVDHLAVSTEIYMGILVNGILLQVFCYPTLKISFVIFGGTQGDSF